MDRILVIGRDSIPELIRLGAGEELRLTLLALPGTSAEVKIQVDLDGPGASLDAAGLCIGRGEDRIHLSFKVCHNSGGCTSRQLFKGLASDRSKVEFDGLILVPEGSQKTRAFQENHNLLLSEGAFVESRPQLEIYADDVECSHGATTGHLDPAEQFYMRSRGIPEAEARRLQILSFISPVLGRLPEVLAGETSRVVI